MRLLLAPGRPAWTDAVAAAAGDCRVVDPLTGALRPVELGLRLLGRRSTRDQLTADAQRRVWAGPRVAVRPGVREVLAPSLAALEAFVLARAVGATCTLLADLPDLGTLHADLDAAAARHACPFLKNHRATRALVDRQAAEWAMADRVWVRSRFAAQGHPNARPFPSRPAPLTTGPGPFTIRLAGLASARSGAAEALAAIEALPEVRLRVRLGDGAWPAGLRDHPRVVSGEGPDHMVWAPTWVESGDGEVAAAAQLGLPIVATDRGAGWTQATLIPRGDIGALVAATRAVLRQAA